MEAVETPVNRDCHIGQVDPIQQCRDACRTNTSVAALPSSCDDDNTFCIAPCQNNCQGSVTLWIGDMMKYTEETKKNPDLHQQKNTDLHV